MISERTGNKKKKDRAGKQERKERKGGPAASAAAQKKDRRIKERQEEAGKEGQRDFGNRETESHEANDGGVPAADSFPRQSADKKEEGSGKKGCRKRQKTAVRMEKRQNGFRGPEEQCRTERYAPASEVLQREERQHEKNGDHFRTHGLSPRSGCRREARPPPLPS